MQQGALLLGRAANRRHTRASEWNLLALPLESLGEFKRVSGQAFLGRPDSATLAWCSYSYQTEQDAKDARSLAHSGQDIDMWYVNDVGK